MKDGATWTFNPECCTLLSEAPAAAAAAAATDAATDADADDVESSSGDDEEESIQITCMLSVVSLHVST